MMMTTIFSSKTVSDLTESIIQIQQQLMYKDLPLTVLNGKESHCK